MDSLDMKRLNGELCHYKAQLAGKLGRLRRMFSDQYANGTYAYSEYAVATLATQIGSVGLKYLALKERIDAASIR